MTTPIKQKTVLLAGAILLVAIGVGFAQPFTPLAKGEAERLVRRFVEAFNKHDVAAMAALVSDDVQWLNVKGSTVEIETDGKAALEKGMTAYFRTCSSCRSELESVMVAGSYVTLYERARWESKSGPRAQRSLAVYEVRDGLIRRAWYYPAEK